MFTNIGVLQNGNIIQPSYGKKKPKKDSKVKKLKAKGHPTVQVSTGY